ncbi:MAG: hypothetical protein P4L85_26595 [Paludisphaera borealis]|uniref:hypothetical protein n=1 Tax=Paludisphaera borealis TaxID=1387353 RepID=UPI0028420A19|nr:hypothetical protein [Paludisphaera borealis]MDR3622951.1 hypothetical protein [Paludisphaera borealis]
MPHSRFDWAGRIKAAEREYQAVRLALDWLLNATPDELHDITEARDWDDLAAADAYAADRNLDATYLIRMYSVFERAISSYWRLLPHNADRTVEGDVLIDEVGSARRILTDLIVGAQSVRMHRNRLVHGRIDDHAATMVFADARRDLLSFLDKLPEAWG